MTKLSITVETTALKSLIRRVEGLDPIIAELAADQAEQEALRRVPVRTGDLKGTIHTEFRGGFWSLVAGSADVLYAIWVEFGTRKMAAQPYLVPALNSIRWSTVLRQALRRVGLK